ncbi:uncharacterized protein CDAR_430171 [Caerostris darwini]|uniref:Uncharacterized protein n=1 Tax=Caerostris darwini TaxID=1538125 RepID=A0AAV4TLI3_9ARAC|nr:uncharacterized protein CDAR_430171 [Caerostris darwini]
MIQEENRENSPGSRLSNFSGQPGAARDCHRNIPGNGRSAARSEKLEIPGNPGVILSRLSGANGVKRKNVYESRDPILTLLPFHPLIPPHPPESMIQEENRENSPGSRLSNFSGQPGAARDCHRNIPGNGVSG